MFLFLFLFFGLNINVACFLGCLCVMLVLFCFVKLYYNNVPIHLKGHFTDVTTTCQVTHAGTEMYLSDTGISLTIPPDAIPKEKQVDISLSLSLDDDYPELDEGHMLICPIVKCQPSRTRFLKPSILTLPCIAGSDVKDGVTIWTKRSASGNM